MSRTMTASNKNVADTAFARDVLAGLARPEKNIAPKWLYDTHGSAIFEDITRTEDYYPTRTEAAIFDEMMGELASITGTGGGVAEYGSGASVKTAKLIDAVRPTLYVPIDIAGEFMEESVGDLRAAYPEMDIEMVVADFTKTVALPDAFNRLTPRIGFFPGSTIGNFESGKAGEFLGRVRESLTEGGGDGWFLVCADLVKDRETLKRAYDDSEGVTAAFNLNLLTRFNRELDADFDVEAFHHEAVWNEKESRIEMHLVSDRDQSVSVAGETIAFAAGEHIHTENSHKYTPQRMTALAEGAGWTLEKMWTDPKEWFGVFLLRA